MGFMMFGQNPGLEWKASRIRAQNGEEIRLGDQPGAGAQLLLYDIAKYAPFFVIEVGLGTVDLLPNTLRNHRQRDQLRVRVLQRRAGRLPVILEHYQVSQAMVLAQIERAVLESPKQILDLLF